MMANERERNALAELAGRLETHIIPISGSVGSRAVGMRIADDIRKAKRIIAELAKADSIYAADPVTNNCVKLQLEAFKNCRAIAAEGDSDAQAT